MNHHDAKKYLVEFAEGVLDGQILRDLTSHIETCSDCQSWLEAYDFMASSVSLSTGSEHPSSELIALCAVRAEEEFEPDEFELHQHLDDCGQCRHEIDVVGAALKQAKPFVENSESLRKPTSSRAWWWKTAAAAVFLGILIGSLLDSSTWHRQKPDHEPPMIAKTALPGPAPAHPGPSNTKFSEAEIKGERLIESDGSLTISDTKIMAGAVVTIQAVKTVAFGNGFEIGPRTRVEVGVSSGNNHQGFSEPKGGRKATG